MVEVPVEGREKNVVTSLVQSEKREDASDEYHPFVLLHGFDSSCLEYRRLFPKLEENGAEVYALDLLGWGFTDGLDGGVGDYSLDETSVLITLALQTRRIHDMNRDSKRAMMIAVT